MDNENKLLKDICIDIIENGVNEATISCLEETLLLMINRVAYDMDNAMLMEYLTRVSETKLPSSIFRLHIYIYTESLKQHVSSIIPMNGKKILPDINLVQAADDNSDETPSRFRIADNKYEGGNQ